MKLKIGEGVSNFPKKKSWRIISYVLYNSVILGKMKLRIIIVKTKKLSMKKVSRIIFR